MSYYEGNSAPDLGNVVSVEIKALLVVSFGIILVINVLSLIALQRTRKTPQTARFLSSALLVFDIGTIFFYASKNFIVVNPGVAIVGLLGLNAFYLAYIDIAMMSVERLVLVAWPNFYLRSVSHTKVKWSCVACWVVFSIIWTIAMVPCILKVGLERDFCITDTLSVFGKLIFSLSAIACTVSFIVITAIIVKQRKKMDSNRGILDRNKSTIAVFCCFINYMLTAVCNISVNYISVIAIKLLVMDIVMIINALADTGFYVLWYRECRMELLKMAAMCFPCLKSRIEPLRQEVFNVMHSNPTS